VTDELDDDAALYGATQVGPWAAVPTWVLTLGLTGTELAVYVALRSFADRDGAARPYIRTLMVRAGVSRSTVKRALDRFRDLQLIRTRQRTTTAGAVAGLDYWLRDVPVIHRWVQGEPTPVQGEPGVGSPVEPGVGSPGEPVMNTPKNTPKNTITGRVTARLDVVDDFETWWSHYPRKVGKATALKAYVKARQTQSADELLAAVQAYALDANLPAKEFRPHPATWLRGGRWEDEPEPVRERDVRAAAEAKRSRAGPAAIASAGLGNLPVPNVDPDDAPAYERELKALRAAALAGTLDRSVYELSGQPMTSQEVSGAHQ
jgi:hypothetical protein